MKHKFRGLVAAVVAVAVATGGLSACSSGGGDTRTIKVDYQSDDFAGIFLNYYPRTLTVKPGMTVRFEQTWTGEPHSVTMGKIVDEGYEPLRDEIEGYADGSLPIPEEPPADYDFELWGERLPFMFGDGDGMNQSASLPCFVPKESDLPKDKAKPCAKKFREEQPEFDGTHAYYSSGFIPFEGDLANEFEVKLSDGIEDGKYAFYCNLHDVLMSGELTVDRDAKIESQGDINRRGAAQAAREIKPIKANLDKERAGEGEFPLPLAGSGTEELSATIHAEAVEFSPSTINTTVGEKVTWTFIGDHTITFNVPPYTPLFKFDKRGYLGFNGSLDKPKGGWPGAPDRDDIEGEWPKANVDAGEWDGTGGQKSSGTGWDTGDTYSITFTKAGTYPYACLIHPGQIGKVVVK